VNQVFIFEHLEEVAATMATATRLHGVRVRAGVATLLDALTLPLVWPLLRALHWFALSCDSVRDIVQRMLRQCSTVVLPLFYDSSTVVPPALRYRYSPCLPRCFAMRVCARWR
jgi:hypothetical protein